MRKSLVKKSKFLSLVLRHDPSAAGVALDENGWVLVSELLGGAAERGMQISLEELEEIVETNEKKRFSYCQDSGRIRARQGHSVEVDVELKAVSPPDSLYHGTAERSLPTIMKEGLKRMNRQHVHLSSCEKTARHVGARHGKPVILKVNAKAMYEDGHLFYLSENHVWLVDFVESKYLSLADFSH
ncbi:putative RNA 2'-phosphotransferase [Rubritalea squalenifaciens DSM 18772]|uniref:Probable RNA 2'-phosphotransferase n=1 Tax=Rubritalea squalenifaciens DSM 18772 TaxID=1123071 RepID=A0A1M6L6T0_9BACT|nr:RNA 2'-phosphotransferase [Rubritalea squalenifaciens]SHJ66958.1 putative RNA 2'-phosphotransferase [Rubritalea squalenifaciens DSM 18772]